MAGIGESLIRKSRDEGADWFDLPRDERLSHLWPGEPGGGSPIGVFKGRPRKGRTVPDDPSHMDYKFGRIKTMVDDAGLMLDKSGVKIVLDKLYETSPTWWSGMMRPDESKAFFDEYIQRIVPWVYERYGSDTAYVVPEYKPE